MLIARQKHPYRELFSTISSLPFLFIGSGVSRRYMKLPNWEELLRRFAIKVYPENPLALEVFINQIGGRHWPRVSSLIEARFNEIWLTSPDYAAHRDVSEGAVKLGASPFKLELAAFFKSAQKATDSPRLLDELSCLGNIAKRSVAGVITTNYDLLPEVIFKGYKTYIGQEQLLFGDVQGVNEIYKIHGCCSDPHSIVISEVDYQDFDRKNAYLAAKLLTVFVEHPIIFLGYSLQDPNIKSILAAIIDCLSARNLQLLKQRMIFVEYTDDPNEAPVIAEHSVNFDGGRSIEMTKVTLNDFLPLYSELLGKKYQYNPKLLRQLKRDIYQLITTNEPVDRFKIHDIEDDGLENVGVLAGVGIVAMPEGGRAHRIPDPADLFCDIILDNGRFDLKSLVEDALAKLQRSHSHSLPVHKYVAAYRSEFNREPPAELLLGCKNSLDGLLNKSLQDQRKHSPIESFEELVAIAPSPEKWLELFPRLTDPSRETDKIKSYLQNYLLENPTELKAGNQGLKTNLRRVIRIYDWIKYGKAKDA